MHRAHSCSGHVTRFLSSPGLNWKLSDTSSFPRLPTCLLSHFTFCNACCAALFDTPQAPRQPKRHFDQIKALTRVNPRVIDCIKELCADPANTVVLFSGSEVGAPAPRPNMSA